MKLGTVNMMTQAVLAACVVLLCIGIYVLVGPRGEIEKTAKEAVILRIDLDKSEVDNFALKQENERLRAENNRIRYENQVLVLKLQTARKLPNTKVNKIK